MPLTQPQKLSKKQEEEEEEDKAHVEVSRVSLTNKTVYS